MLDILEDIKPQLDAVKQVYKAAFEAGVQEGRRQVWIEVKQILQDKKESKNG